MASAKLIRVVTSMSALCLLLLAGCSGHSDPYSYVKVHGTLTYEDGSLIPAQEIGLTFVPDAASIGKTHPKAGFCFIDTKTGEFRDVTTHTPFDGLVRGKHKVQVTGQNHVPLPTTIVPAEYADPSKTPLVVDTDHLPFEIKVAKPASKGARG
jgi:hypothetical protein